MAVVTRWVHTCLGRVQLKELEKPCGAMGWTSPPTLPWVIPWVQSRCGWAPLTRTYLYIYIYVYVYFTALGHKAEEILSCFVFE